VLFDVVQGKVSREAAEHDYGVVVARGRPPSRRWPPGAVAVVESGEEAYEVVDEDATARLRARLRAERPPRPFFDRGAGYARLADGATQAAVDELSATERAAVDASRDRHTSRASGSGSGRHTS
jgi:N-methylhydantoinase B